MFILSENKIGVAAKVTEDIISGLFVTVASVGALDRECSKVAASGDIASGVNWGLGYYDTLKAARERGTRTLSANLDSANPEAIAKVDNGQDGKPMTLAVLGGYIRGSTNQLDDGTYTPGLWLTVNPTTARLKPAGASDVKHGKVELTQRPVKVTNQDKYVALELQIPNGF
jgi:hypothetical protein